MVVVQLWYHECEKGYRVLLRDHSRYARNNIFGNFRTSYLMTQAGLSYRASRGLLVGEPGGRASGPVHYALYELGRVL